MSWHVQTVADTSAEQNSKSSAPWEFLPQRRQLAVYDNSVSEARECIEGKLAEERGQ